MCVYKIFVPVPDLTRTHTHIYNLYYNTTYMTYGTNLTGLYILHVHIYYVV